MLLWHDTYNKNTINTICVNQVNFGTMILMEKSMWKQRHIISSCHPPVSLICFDNAAKLHKLDFHFVSILLILGTICVLRRICVFSLKTQSKNCSYELSCQPMYSVISCHILIVNCLLMWVAAVTFQNLVLNFWCCQIFVSGCIWLSKLLMVVSGWVLQYDLGSNEEIVIHHVCLCNHQSSQLSKRNHCWGFN